jgi:hypothetical protein
MPEHTKLSETLWLAVIGKALAYLCLQEAARKEPQKFDTVVRRVEFLENLGLSLDDSAVVVGSSGASVRELRRQARAARGAKASGKKKR